MWRVGSTQNVGTRSSVLEATGSVILPEHLPLPSQWRLRHPLSAQWLDAPALRILPGAEGAAALEKKKEWEWKKEEFA